MDVARISQSVVTVRAIVPDTAYTAGTLGTLREGSGVVIRANGLVLTMGYLITEAEEIWLTSHDGRVLPAHVMAYDQETGFGLLQPLGRLDLPALEFGNAQNADIGDKVLIVDGEGQAVDASIVAKQEFAGYWEYLLNEAIFVAPSHPSWGGAALVDESGKLLGIGSLRLEMNRNTDINMIVPINLLLPILDEMLTSGQVNKLPRPWLGLFSAESDGKVVVVNVAKDGPAAQAGLREGDIISDIRDEEVESLADFYRKLWKTGSAGVEITVRVVREGRDAWLRVKSDDRRNFLLKPSLQ